jgi:hypothetical protein
MHSYFLNSTTLLMAGRAKMTALAGKCQQILMAAVLAFHKGKAVVRVAVVQIPVDHLLDIGPPETILMGKVFIVDSDKGFKAVLHAAVITG